jgi:predicted small metal-binding protein
VRVVVECECGWTSSGDENAVVEAMQVHQRQIHGREMTRDEVRGKTRPA